MDEKNEDALCEAMFGGPAAELDADAVDIITDARILFSIPSVSSVCPHFISTAGARGVSQIQHAQAKGDSDGVRTTAKRLWRLLLRLKAVVSHLDYSYQHLPVLSVWLVGWLCVIVAV